jgi:ABC-type antimicrobial peptide transport system permease subunit
MSYAVNRRIPEIGIRAALGASRQEIMRLILRQGMKLVVWGMIGELAISILRMRLMAGMLYGVRPADPLTLAGVTLLMGIIALFACYIPARRATSVDPVSALKSE